jgi:hypothetical protein
MAYLIFLTRMQLLMRSEIRMHGLLPVIRVEFD